MAKVHKNPDKVWPPGRRHLGPPPDLRGGPDPDISAEDRVIEGHTKRHRMAHVIGPDSWRDPHG